MRILSVCCLGSLLALHSLFVVLWITTGSLYYVNRVYGPTLEYPFENDKDHLGYCSPSTDDLDDLIIDKDMTLEEAKEVADEHGSAIVSSVLTKESAQALRDYVMKANHELQSTYVQDSEHRYHIMPPHSEPSVQEALKQVGQHPVVRPLIDALLGPSSTLVSLTVLTSEYGVVKQDYHGDTSTSHAGYPDSIVPEYTIAIALQDITEDMGATGLCPGTHKCREVDEDDFEDYGYYRYSHLSPSSQVCRVRATLEQGDALLFSTDLHHCGRAHLDPNAPARAMAFFVFAASRQGPDDKRVLPLGMIHALHWKSWGHTIDDCAAIKDRPWSLWDIFGLFRREQTVRPWTLLDDLLMLFADDDETVHTVSVDLDREHFSNAVDTLFKYSIISTIVYALVVLPLVAVVGMLAFLWHQREVSLNVKEYGVKIKIE